MNVTEIIYIVPNDKYTLKLPVEAQKVIDRLNAHGLPFGFGKGAWEDAPFLEDDYIPDRIDQVRQIVADEGWDVRVRHRALPTFTDDEWSQGAFRSISIPEKVVEPELGYHTLKKSCPTCGQVSFEHKPIRIMKKFSTKHHFLSPGVVPDIAAADVADELAQQLIGIRLEPFDAEGRFKYIVPDVTADPAIVHDGDMIGYKGMCEECDRPIRDGIIGLIRYSKDKLQGLDVVRTKIFDATIYSPRAVELIKAYEDDIEEYPYNLYLLE